MPGQTMPGDPLIDPNVDPALGPSTNGAHEPDEATLEQLIAMLQMMGVGGSASGMPAGPMGQGLPMQSPPGEGAMGGAGPNGPGGTRPGMMMPPGGGPPPNPLLAAMGQGGPPPGRPF